MWANGSSAPISLTFSASQPMPSDSGRSGPGLQTAVSAPVMRLFSSAFASLSIVYE